MLILIIIQSTKQAYAVKMGPTKKINGSTAEKKWIPISWQNYNGLGTCCVQIMSVNC